MKRKEDKRKEAVIEKMLVHSKSVTQARQKTHEMVELKRELNFKLARQRRDMAEMITVAEK